MKKLGTGIRQIKGIDKVAKNLRRVRKQQAASFEHNIVRAALIFQRASQQLTPVRYGILRNSASTRKRGAGFRSEVFVAYTASYAVFVHENVGANFKVGRAKFLETAIKSRANRNLAAMVLAKGMDINKSQINADIEDA